MFVTQGSATNRKRILCTDSMAQAGVALLKARGDVEIVPFPYLSPEADYQALLRQHAPVHATILSATRFGKAELALAPALQVIARIGVGFDAIDIPAMTAARVPVMTVGIANSPSVAEHAVTLMMTLAKKGPALSALVKESRWGERLHPRNIAVDLYQKTLLIVGFGRIGTRTAKRCLAMEMQVLVYDPYVSDEAIRAAGCEPVRDLDAGVARADFVSIHCPKTKETIGMFDAARLGRMKHTAYLVSTARGGIVDEAALYAALRTGRLPAAGLDVFDREPPDAGNPLFTLPNLIASPHIAGVTVEAMDRMAVQAAENVLSVFDGRPLVENVVNREIYA
jgi:D-3-phosphoglycerate dehydrogenase